IIEVGNDNAYATLELLEFPLANVRLRPRIGHPQDFDAAPAGKIIGRGARSASEVKQTHSIRRLQQDAFSIVRARKGCAGKTARAVIVILAAILTKPGLVRAILVVVFEKVFSFRCPLDELPLFEFIQRVTDVASVPRMGDEEKEHVMSCTLRTTRP